MFQASLNNLLSKEHGLTLSLFRIIGGLILSYNFFSKASNEELKRYFSSEFNHFQYCGFEWAQPLTYNGTNVLLIAIGIGFLLLAIGFLYRYVTWFLLVTVSYFYLLESAVYNNHYYFIVLLLGFFCVTNANAYLSLDQLLGGRKPQAIPRWQRLIFAFQVSVVYFYGGLAKLHPDWISGRITRADLSSTYSEHFSEIQMEWLTQFFTWGGLVFDLAVPFLLLSKRTRPWAFFPITVFHIANEARFDIGVFPILMLSATILFFSPNELGKFFKRVSGKTLIVFTSEDSTLRKPLRQNAFTLSALAIFCAFQLLFPLRHYFDGRDILWSKIGYRFSWHMKMSHSVTSSQFFITDKEGSILHEVATEDYIDPRQAHSMHVYPANSISLAQWVEQDLKELYRVDTEIRTDFKVGLNGRPLQQWSDPTMNLLANTQAKCNYNQHWILKKPF